MRKTFGLVLLTVFGCAGFALGQQPVPAPPPPAAGANQLTPQVLGQMLKSATTFHQLVQNLNLNNALGPDVHQVGADGQLHHSIERTAAAVGAGAGAGAAIGAMTRSQNGVLIGALVGSAGGLILDQILKAREEQQAKAAYAVDPGPAAYPAPRPYDPNSAPQLRERK